MQDQAPGPPRACLSLILLAERLAGMCGAGHVPEQRGKEGAAPPSSAPAPPALRALLPAPPCPLHGPALEVSLLPVGIVE